MSQTIETFLGRIATQLHKRLVGTDYEIQWIDSSNLKSLKFNDFYSSYDISRNDL